MRVRTRTHVAVKRGDGSAIKFVKLTFEVVNVFMCNYEFEPSLLE